MLRRVSIDGTEPSSTLITLDQAKRQCYFLPSEDDSDIEALLTLFVSVAREYAESHTWRTLIESTYTLYLDEFPVGDMAIELPRPPAITVSSVKYYDADDTIQTWASSKYQVDTASEPARVKPVDGEDWPETYERMNAVEITYTAGYNKTDAGSDPQHVLPDKIRQAMLLLVKHFYHNRDAVVVGDRSSVDLKEVPMTVEALLDFESARQFV